MAFLAKKSNDYCRSLAIFTMTQTKFRLFLPNINKCQLDGVFFREYKYVSEYYYYVFEK